MEYTRKISEFVVKTRYEEIPVKAIETSKKAIIDCVGVTLAGSRESAGRIAAELVREEKSNGEASVFGQGFKSSALMAALANRTASHALDYDYSFTLMGQPTAGLAPAIFAMGEAVGACGRDFLEAFVVGFEVTTKLAWSMPEHSSKGGWHATGTLDSLGTTAACSKLLRLNREAVQMALGIATSMASGVVWNFGTMTKPLHAGLAARNGVLAAKLASKGFTGNPLVLEGAKGFHESFSRELPIDLAPLEGLGVSFDVVEQGVRFKAYPCGGLTHSAIDATLEMRKQHSLTAQMIDVIRVGVTPHAHSRIVYRIPKSGLQGKFSMAYILARAIIDGKVTLDTFTDEAVLNPAVLNLAEKVQMEVDPDLEENEEGSRPCTVMVHLKDGRSLSRSVEYPKGTPQSPLSAKELKEKFVECAKRALKEKAANQALEMLEALEGLESVAPLCQLLMAEAANSP